MRSRLSRTPHRASAHRPVRDATSARRGGALSRRRRARARRRSARAARAKRPARSATCSPSRRSKASCTRNSPRDDKQPPTYRPVTIVNAAERKQLKLRIEVPVEDMARLGHGRIGSFRAGRRRRRPTSRASIWTSIHPRLLELIRAHRSTLLFVNSRRLAERLAGALNELAGEPLVRSHHGSLARARAQRGRRSAQGRAHQGARRHLVARARHRHGRDRSGRADRGAAVGRERPAAHRPRRPSGRCASAKASSFRSSAATSSPAPRSRGPCTRAGRVDALSAQSARRARAADRRDGRHGRRGTSTSCSRVVRCAAPFADLSRADVRRRARHAVGPLPVGRIRGAAAARHLGSRARHARRRARAPSASRSPTPARFPTAGSTACSSRARDRPAASASSTRRWCSRRQVGETFMLGASTWRIEEITHDRVLVSPAPGEPGKMPFWHGDRAGRPMELGLRDRQAGARAPRRRRGRRRSIASSAQHDLDTRRRGKPAAIPRRSGRHRARSPTTGRS